MIKIISGLIRIYLIPNPFAALRDGLTVYIGGNPFLLNPTTLNKIVEPFLFVITFTVVGIYYRRNTLKSLGSFLYLLFYCFHIVILWVLSLFNFNIFAVVVVLAIYIAMHIHFYRRYNLVSEGLFS